jgi:hypothetical protein
MIRCGLTVAAALTLFSSPAAFAAGEAPSLTASPSTGLSDGQSIAVSVAGFSADTGVDVAECAGMPGSSLVCDVRDQVSLTSDASGAGSTTLTVYDTFPGTDINGNVTTVDCATVTGGCFVGARTASQEYAAAAISFQ